MTGSINRKPCPQCGLTNNLYISIEFVVARIGDFSLAGMQVKFPGRERPVLKCHNCPFELPGEFSEGTHAVFNLTGVQSSDASAPDATAAPAS